MRRAAVTGLLSVVAVASGCGGGATGTGTGANGGSTDTVAAWVAAEKLPAAARPGAREFLAQSCTTCHTYLDTGTSVAGSPELTSEGLLHRGLGWQLGHLSCPACLVKGSAMPKYDTLGQKKLHDLAVFLEASKGKR
jgi:mono/diheme cytochrome c family protein